MHNAHLRTDRVGIRLNAAQRHAQTPRCSLIEEKFGLGSVLGHGEIHATIVIEISEGRPPLLTGDIDAADGRIDRCERSFAIAGEPKTSAGIVAADLILTAEEILCEKQVLLTIGI